MRRVRVTVFIAMGAVLLSFAPPSVHAAECGRQGAFALAVAQLLGYGVADQKTAMEVLTKVGVEPKGGWTPKACVTAEVATETDKDLKNAVENGIFSPKDIAGVVALALESIGEADILQRLAGILSPSMGRPSRVGGPPLEGSPFIPSLTEED